MIGTGFEHHRMDMVELTYKHYTSLGTYALHLFHTICYNLCRHSGDEGHL
jgi:hypothetical protein